MTFMTIIVVALLIGLLVLEMPVAFALAIAGAVGLFFIGGFVLVHSYLADVFYQVTSSYILLAVPMFVLMAQYLAHGGIARDIVVAGDVWLGRLRGGLGMACVASSALLASVIGTSTASCATMSTAIYPHMREVGYQPRLAIGIIAIAGTLAIMIPPSLILIVYGILTEESIGRLFLAGVGPGLLTAAGYIVTIMYYGIRHPEWVPKHDTFDLQKAVKAIIPVWPIMLLVFVVMGSLYMGIATPTEVGAIGALAALVIVLALRRLDRARFVESVGATVSTTIMIIAIICGAMLFGYFLTLTQTTQHLLDAVQSAGLSPWTVLLIIIGVYLILGMFMDQMAILVLTVPTTYALVSQLGFDGIWFGILITKTVEIGLVSPPLGLNVYVASNISKVPVGECFKGVLPFIAVEVVVLALLLLFPQISLWLPTHAFS